MKNRTLNPSVVGFIVLLAVLASSQLSIVNQLNRLCYDLIVTSQSKREVPPVVSIADVDEKALRTFGRWPWPRDVIARVFEKLDQMGAKVIAFDGTFSEPDHESGVKTIEGIRNELLVKQPDIVKAFKRGNVTSKVNSIFDSLAAQADTDTTLAMTLANLQADSVMGVFIGFDYRDTDIKSEAYLAGFTERKRRLEKAFVQVVDLSSNSRLQKAWTNPVDLVVPIPSVTEAVSTMGYFNNFLDPDGTSRSNVLVHRIGESYIPSLPLAAVARYLDGEIQLVGLEDGSVSLQILNKDGSTQHDIITDKQTRAYYDFYGKSFTVPYFSIADLMQDKVDAQLIRNRIIFFGFSAPAVGDFTRIPTEVVRGIKTPGVELHATMAANILSDSNATVNEFLYAILLFVVPILFLLVIAKTGAMTSLLVMIGVCLAELLFVFRWFEAHRDIVWVALPLLAIVAVYVAVTFTKYLAEEAQKKFIKHAFGHYLSPVLVDQIADNPDLLHLSGERRVLTVLFSDIRDFTSISERLTPSALRRLLADYLTPMTEIITKKNMGTLDKYIGDAIMAFFGAPLDLEGHALYACRSALEMSEELKRLRLKESFPPIETGIGINTGEVSVGNMGSEEVFDYTALGDGVNLASRLEGITKQYRVQIVVSESTQAAAREEFLFRELDRIRVKGKEQAVTIYQLIHARDQCSSEDKEIVESFEAGLQAYRDQKFSAARALFQSCLQIAPNDYPAQIFIERCQVFSEDPPGENWDGVYRFHDK